MLSRISKQNQRVFINNTGIVGIQDFSANYSAPIDLIKSLGMESVTYHNNANISANLTINKLLIDNDPFINLIDYDKTFSGYIDYKDKYFAFNSGIVNSYNLSCSIGEIPKLSVEVITLGEFGSGVLKAAPASLETPPIDITDYSNIEITLDDFQFNRLQNFSLNISADKNVIYSIGNAYPIEVKIIPPIIVELEFTIKADEYEIKNIRDLVCKYKVDNFEIKFNKFKNPNIELFKFVFNEALFMGESFGGSASNSSEITIRYNAFIYDQRNIPLSTPLNQGDTSQYFPSPLGPTTTSSNLAVGDTSQYFPSPLGPTTQSNVLPNDPGDLNSPTC
jgi:hypothetical protein